MGIFVNPSASISKFSSAKGSFRLAHGCRMQSSKRNFPLYPLMIWFMTTADAVKSHKSSRKSPMCQLPKETFINFPYMWPPSVFPCVSSKNDFKCWSLFQRNCLILKWQDLTQASSKTLLQWHCHFAYHDWFPQLTGMKKAKLIITPLQLNMEAGRISCTL